MKVTVCVVIPTVKIEEKAMWMSVFLNIPHCIFNGDSSKTPENKANSEQLSRVKEN